MHVDHYAELTAAHRGDVPIYTSPATATILDDVFDVATNKYDITASEAVTSAITPIDDWTDVVPDIEIHPVPAGHVPGAVGFLFRVTDDDDTHHILATVISRPVEREDSLALTQTGSSTSTYSF